MVRHAKLVVSELYIPGPLVYEGRVARRSCRLDTRQEIFQTCILDPSAPPIMTHVSCRRRWWTQEEDHTLQAEIKSQRKCEPWESVRIRAHGPLLIVEVGGQQGARNWSAIAQKLPGRSNKDCRKRWTKISLSSRKGTWSSAEDHLLRKAVAKFGLQCVVSLFNTLLLHI